MEPIPLSGDAEPVTDASNTEHTGEAGWLLQLLRAGFGVFIVLLIVAMFPLSPRPAIDVKVALYQLAACAFGGIWLTAIIAGRARLRWPRIFGPILVLTLLCHGALAVGADHSAAGLLNVLQTYCLAVLLLVASHVYTSAREVRPLLVAICIGVGLSSVYAFAQKAGYDPFPWEESQLQTSTYLEMPGTFGNPNIAGHALILAILFAGYLATIRTTRWCAIFIPLFAAHLYLTHFRAGILALAAGVSVMALATLLIRTQRPAALVARVTVTAALLAAVATTGLAVGYAYRASAKDRLLDDSILLRYNAYYGAVRMIADAPLKGFGPGMYAAANPPYWTEYEQRWLAQKHLLNEHVHSDVLEAWVETGLGGAALYVLLLVAGVYCSARLAARSQDEERRFALALAAFFTAFAADGLFGFNSRVPVTAVLLFLFAGVLQGVYRPTVDQLGRTSTAGRIVASILFAGLIAASAFGLRDFLGKVSMQSAQNALAFDALDEADRQSARALRLAPYDPGAHVTRSLVESRLGNFDRAVEEYNLVLQIRPYDVPVLVGLARAHLSMAVNAVQLGNRDESLRALEQAESTAQRALELCQYLPDAQEALGRVALARAGLLEPDSRVDNAQKAERYFLGALSNGAENEAVLFVLAAESQTIVGDDDGAQTYLNRAVEHWPAERHGWQAYVLFAKRTGRFEALDAALGDAINRADRLEDAIHAGRLRAWRARAYQHEGRPFGEVADEFDRALADAPDAAETWKDYASAARASKSERRFLESVREIDCSLPHVKALASAFSGSADAAPQAAEVLYELSVRVMTPGYVELGRADLDWALDYVQGAILNSSIGESGLVSGLAHVASAYETQQMFVEAAEVYRSLMAHTNESTYVAAATKCGSLLVQISRPGEAVVVFETALRTHKNNVPLRIEYARALNAAGKPAAARMELSDLQSRFNLDASQRTAVEAELEVLSR